MKLPWRKTQSPNVLRSEDGFLKLAGRGADLPSQFVQFRELVSAHMEWADSRKARFRTYASWTRIAILLLTAGSTSVLGIPAIPNRTSIALPMVALVTLIGGLEPFYNWRSRWVLMEEAQYRLNHLRDTMDYYLVTRGDDGLRPEKLYEFFEAEQGVWSDVSRQWIEFRKLDQTPPIDGMPPRTGAP